VRLEVTPVDGLIDERLSVGVSEVAAGSELTLTITTVHAGLAKLKDLPDVDSSRLALYAVSVSAIAAAYACGVGEGAARRLDRTLAFLKASLG
jgi:hypothetical protein